ncbi:hypothetical protein ACP70R_038506 [Stipagrostis hirtigluma subsp. patula]
MAAAIHGSPEPKKTDKFPDWVLLERVGRVHCYDDHDAAAAAVENDATAVPVHTTRNKSGYFSFTLRSPPRVSYVDLHWPYGVPESWVDWTAVPFLLTADRNLVLLRIHVANELYYDSPPDLFVYAADPSSPPSLHRLPACDKEAQGYVGIDKFLTVDRRIGILCRGLEDYVVADLVVSWKGSGCPGNTNDQAKPLIAVICTFSYRMGEWKIQEMLAPQPRDQSVHGQFPVLWSCDRVLPFAGRFLCWVDYYNGVLLCDLSDENSPVLCYAPFPSKQYSDEEQRPRGIPESFRSISVCSDGMMMRLVHIGNDWQTQDTGGPCQITMWTLDVKDGNCSWEIQCSIKLDDIWAHHGYQAEGLPCQTPEFPVMTKNDASVVCCVLKEKQCSVGKIWIIMFDMERAAFQFCIRYIDEVYKGLGTDSESIFGDIPLLPSDFSKYLNNQQ